MYDTGRPEAHLIEEAGRAQTPSVDTDGGCGVGVASEDEAEDDRIEAESVDVDHSVQQSEGTRRRADEKRRRRAGGTMDSSRRRSSGGGDERHLAWVGVFR